MQGDGRPGGLMGHLMFVGDAMLLIVPVGGAIMMAGMNMLSAVGGGLGFVLGAALAPAATLLVVWLLRGRPLNRQMMTDVGFSTLIVLALTGALYALVITQELDQNAGFAVSAYVILALEGALAILLLVDAVADLLRKRQHTPLDIARLVAILFAAGLLALFWTNPDFGEFLVVLAPLGLAGGVAGVIGDVFASTRERRASHVETGTPTPA